MLINANVCDIFHANRELGYEDFERPLEEFLECECITYKNRLYYLRYS